MLVSGITLQLFISSEEVIRGKKRLSFLWVKLIYFKDVVLEQYLDLCIADFRLNIFAHMGWDGIYDIGIGIQTS